MEKFRLAFRLAGSVTQWLCILVQGHWSQPMFIFGFPIALGISAVENGPSPHCLLHLACCSWSREHCNPALAWQAATWCPVIFSIWTTAAVGNSELAQKANFFVRSNHGNLQFLCLCITSWSITCLRPQSVMCQCVTRKLVLRGIIWFKALYFRMRVKKLGREE